MPDKKVKFNIVDAIILVAVILAVTFVGIKMFGGEDTPLAKEEIYSISFRSESIPSFVADEVSNGVIIADETKSISFGEAKNVVISDASVYSADAEGKLVKSAKEGYNSIEITCEVSGVKGSHGILVEGMKYTVGHSFTLNAGDSKFNVQVSDITKK